MKILAIEKERPATSHDSFAASLEAEAMCVWQLYQDGVLRELYFQQDKSEAVLILECNDATEARRVLDTLPLVRSGLIDFEIIPLIPYPGFARLFAP